MNLKSLGLIAYMMMWLTAAAPANAHAIVIGSTPKAGAVISAAPFEITIRFNSRIDAARSTLVVLDADRASTGIALTAGTTPDLLTAQGPALTPGRYRLRWQVLALDGHITRGDIAFTVSPAP